MILLVSSFTVSCKGESDPALPVAVESGGNDSERPTGEVLEFCFIQTEIALAGTRRTYLVIDPDRSEIAIKQAGNIVWDCPVHSMTGEAAGLETFVEEFRGEDDRFYLPLTSKYLYEAMDRTPDSLLSIVGRVVKVDPMLLQREVPERFQLTWEEGITLEVRTGVDGKPVSRFRNLVHDLPRWLAGPFEKDIAVVIMDPEDALTLYRVSERGMPALLSPVTGTGVRRGGPS